ncbi:MAG: HAD family phosphatase [Neomegalonema sp.]|nr:HAD family phosphatase [Neomegalonema sp.]
MSSARPELVIFDCDGVLVDSEPVAARVIAARLTQAGWPIGADELGHRFKGGTLFGVRDEVVAAGFPLPEDWVEQVYAELFDALVDTPPIPGVEKVLDLLDVAGLPYCIGSNGPHTKMDVTLKSTGLFDRFQGRRFSAREVPAPKPAPDLFLHAASQLNADPTRSVVVGDTQADARAAQAAGMRCFGYAAATPQQDFLSYGATPFGEMAELPALLGL